MARSATACTPRLIFDLGGGSLELNFYQRGVLEHRIGFRWAPSG